MTKPQQPKPLTEDEVLLRMLKTKPKPHKPAKQPANGGYKAPAPARTGRE